MHRYSNLGFVGIHHFCASKNVPDSVYVPIDSLLIERSSEIPSGNDLEYDPEFLAMEKAAQIKPERQSGAEFLSGEEPDYTKLRQHALAVLDRAHDLRAAIFLARALLQTEGVQGFAEGVALLRGLLEQWWPTCHPLLDPDDGDDPTARINTVLGLVDNDTTLRGVLLAPLAQSPALGHINLRDIAISLGEIAGGTPDAATVSAAFRDTDTALLESRQAAVLGLRRDLDAISAVFDKHTPGQGPDFAPLDRLLRRAAMQFADALGNETQPDGPVDEAVAQEAAAPAQKIAAAPVGAISSAADVRAALDRIMAFYAANEPSSPLPILLSRARKLVGADFITIMKEIAPGGVENVRNLAGLQDDD